MEVKFLKIKDIYINVDEIKKVKKCDDIGTYCIYLKDNSQEELSYQRCRSSGTVDEYQTFITWLNSNLLRY
jgi:hypothetical protein